MQNFNYVSTDIAPVDLFLFGHFPTIYIFQVFKNKGFQPQFTPPFLVRSFFGVSYDVIHRDLQIKSDRKIEKQIVHTSICYKGFSVSSVNKHVWRW